VLATAMQIGKKIGKVAVVSGVCPASSATACSRRRQAQANMLMEGAMPWDVDRVLYDFGMPMGPFADERPGRPRHRLEQGDEQGRAPCASVLCEMDRRGQKTGAGFYDYDEKRNARPSEVTRRSSSTSWPEKAGITARKIGDRRSSSAASTR
jgi:3-hydroxyacyl-CoA dehydrogenase